MTAPIGGNDEDEKSGKSISYLLFNVPNGKCSKYLLIILFAVSKEGLEYFLLKKQYCLWSKIFTILIVFVGFVALLLLRLQSCLLILWHFFVFS